MDTKMWIKFQLFLLFYQETPENRNFNHRGGKVMCRLEYKGNTFRSFKTELSTRISMIFIDDEDFNDTYLFL